MFKRLFFAVLGFWLLKKYVKPYFDDRRDGAAPDETATATATATDER